MFQLIPLSQKSFARLLGMLLLLWAGMAQAYKSQEFPATGGQPYIIKDGQKSPLYTASYALLISAAEYLGVDKQGWPQLHTTEEVDDVQEALRKHGFNVTRVWDPNHIELNQVYKDFAAKYGREKNHRLLFLFAGHGHTIKDYGYIVPIDASDPNIDPEGFLAKAKPIQELMVLAAGQGMTAKHALFVFDSCFSGAVFAKRGLENPDTDRVNFFQTSADKPVRQFITAGNENQKVPDNPKFGHMLIEGLSGTASTHKDGYVTGKELGLWLEQTMPKFAGGKQSPHSGLIDDSDLAFGDMVFQVPDFAPVVLKTEQAPIEQPKATPKIATPVPESPALTVRKDCDYCPEMVKLPTEIWMGKYEVTQAQWRAVMPENPNPSHFKACGDDCPVEQVSWNDVQEYIKRVNSQTGGKYRLPNEEEWFAACQAGKANDYCGSDDFDSVAWWFGNSTLTTHPIGKKNPNAWQLYDLSGNVWEWTNSCYESDCTGRVLRGGSWIYLPGLPAFGDPYRGLPVTRRDDIGFRLAQD